MVSTKPVLGIPQECFQQLSCRVIHGSFSASTTQMQLLAVKFILPHLSFTHQTHHLFHTGLKPIRGKKEFSDFIVLQLLQGLESQPRDVEVWLEGTSAGDQVQPLCHSRVT